MTNNVKSRQIKSTQNFKIFGLSPNTLKYKYPKIRAMVSLLLDLTSSSVAYIADFEHAIVSWVLISMKNMKSHIIRRTLVTTATAKKHFKQTQN